MPSNVSEEIMELILAKNPRHRKFLASACEAMTASERDELDRYLAFHLEGGTSQDDLVEAYLLIVQDTFREEIFFRKHGRYRHSTYQDVANSVYQNEQYMRHYMIGLALSAYWWPNHVALRRFFRECIRDRVGKVYREIGPGHGLYFSDAMRLARFQTYEGLDISPTSVRMTRDLLATQFPCGTVNYNIVHGDFLVDDNSAPVDCLVMGEVLEHVEEPALFLLRASRSLHPNGFFFLTTCYNSPAIDHIYNPGTRSGLVELIADSGLRVERDLYLGHGGKTIEECEKDRLAVNVGLWLRKETS